MLAHLLLRAALESPRVWFHYWRIEPVTRDQIAALLGAIGLDLTGREVLDLGPARGASLVEFRTRGATATFVERHPLFYLECRRRGFKGVLGDFRKTPDLIPEEIDVLYARGSTYGGEFDEHDLVTWLQGLQRRARTLIITPHCPIDVDHAAFEQSGFDRFQVLGNAAPVYPYTWVWQRPRTIAG